MLFTWGLHHFLHLGVPQLDLDLHNGDVGLDHHKLWLPEHAFWLLNLVLCGTFLRLNLSYFQVK